MSKKLDKTKKTGKGKFEMNLAEFPVAVLSKQVPKDKKTIKYSDLTRGLDKIFACAKIKQKWKL